MTMDRYIRAIAFISFPSSCLGTHFLAQALLGHCIE